MKLATANTLQFIASVLSALLRLRGCAAHAAECTRGVSNARRCANSLSVDWQAWGIHCGLCWQATRDGLRHVPAGPPKSCATENPLTPAPRDTRHLRLSARRATISVEYVSQSVWTKTTRETALFDRESFLRCALTAGAGKKCAPSRPRVVFARGEGGGSGVRG